MTAPTLIDRAPTFDELTRPRCVYPAEFDLQESIHTAIALQAYLDESVKLMDASPHSKTLGAAVFSASSALRKVRGL